MEPILLVITNLPHAQAAQDIAHRLIEQKLAACANCLPAMQSIYRWQGKIETANEVMLLLKTTSQRYPALETALKTMHPYDLPEILAIPVTAAWPAYAAWVAQEAMKEIDV